MLIRQCHVSAHRPHLLSAVTQRCVSSCRPTTCCQLSGRTKHRMLGESFCPSASLSCAISNAKSVKGSLKVQSHPPGKAELCVMQVCTTCLNITVRWEQFSWPVIRSWNLSENPLNIMQQLRQRCSESCFGEPISSI